MKKNKFYKSCTEVILHPNYQGFRLIYYFTKKLTGIDIKITTQSGYVINNNKYFILAGYNWYDEYGKNIKFKESFIIDTIVSIKSSNNKNIVNLNTFDILLIDNNKTNFDNLEIFKLINKDDYLLLSLLYKKSYDDAELYFNNISLKYEGLIIRPIDNNCDYLPYLKVRSFNKIKSIYYTGDYKLNKYLCEIKNKNLNSDLKKFKKTILNK